MDIKQDISQDATPYSQVRNFGLVTANQRVLFEKLEKIEEKLNQFLRNNRKSVKGEKQRIKETMKSKIARDKTGLKDKNGKEICEGDIMKWDDSGDTLEVRWIDSSWQLFGSYNKLASHSWKNGTIIGNIYENPELKTAKG